MSAAVKVLTDDGRIEHDRCLWGFPHPTTGPGHPGSERAYVARRHELSEAVDNWFANAPARARLPARPRTHVAGPSGDLYEPIDDEVWRKVQRTALDMLAGADWKTSSSSRDVLNRVCEARGTRDLLGCWGISDAEARRALGQRGRLPPEIAAALGKDRTANFAGGHPRPKALLALATALSEHTRRRH